MRKDHYIHLPNATFGIAQGVRHNIVALRATMVHPEDFVGALIVHRQGDACPAVAMAHIDDPLVTTATVVAMEKALKPSLIQALTRPVTWCEAIVFCAHKGKQESFWQAARQTFCGQAVTCSHQILPLYSPSNPLSVVYDLREDMFASLCVLAGVNTISPSGEMRRRIDNHQKLGLGVVKDSTKHRANAANCVFGDVVDTDRMNLTGDDYVRMPFMAFDLRARKLTGYIQG